MIRTFVFWPTHGHYQSRSRRYLRPYAASGSGPGPWYELNWRAVSAGRGSPFPYPRAYAWSVGRLSVRPHR